jgi:dihydrodipicolinate synthase/N-acetylneuraminate lyase
LLADAVLLGAHGGVCGGANLCPRLYVGLYEAARDRRMERVVQLHRLVNQLIHTLFGVGKHRSSFLKSLKCALSCIGLCDDFMAAPFRRFQPEQRAEVQRLLAEYGITREHPLPRGADAA